MPSDYDSNDTTNPFESPAHGDRLTQGESYLGIRLKDRYLIEKELGRGNIGVVYLARDQQLISKPVVIKVLLEESDENEWFKKKFRHEIEALARIDHPGVVGVLDAGEMPDGKAYLVMQFIEGRNLRSLMNVDGMELGRVANLMRQIGHALNAAHDKGVFHRDLKPENIMVQDLGEGEELVKLVDFGIAKVKDSQTASSTHMTQVAGTIVYMAPEQLMGEPSAASDIYALGVIAYEMVTGRRPFNPASPFQLYEMQRAGARINPIDLRPSLSATAQAVILQALAFEPKDRPTRAKDFGEALARALASEASPHARPWAPVAPSLTPTIPVSPPVYNSSATALPTRTTTPMRVALLYKRNAQPDEEILQLLESHLKGNGHSIFIDRHLAIGIEWAKEIERQIKNSDAVIPLLSLPSIQSEMLAYEVQTAHEAAQQQRGKPRLLPIRINYDGPLTDQLGSILDPIQYALWHDRQDNQRLVDEVLASLQAPPGASKPLPSSASGDHRGAGALALEAVGGAVPLNSQFYVVRPTDAEFLSALARQDSIVLVKGARQMGKTSLLARGLKQTRQSGAKVVVTDFQKLNAAHLESVESLFLTLAGLIADQLDLDVLPEDVWNPRRGPSTNFERYFRREVLGKISSPLVWGMDEVDRLFTCSYASEVFGLFRSWHNERAIDPEGPWQRLTLAIIYATEAHLFITDLNQSPFNVGTRLVLEDFTFDHVTDLNKRYGGPLQGTAEVARFFRLVGGHPYLVRKGLHEMTAHGMTLAVFEAQADRDEGPYGDHLRRILVLLAQDKELCDVVRQILQGQPCPTTESFYRLRSAGVMAGDSARDARPRCQLYANYLGRHLL